MPPIYLVHCLEVRAVTSPMEWPLYLSFRLLSQGGTAGRISWSMDVDDLGRNRRFHQIVPVLVPSLFARSEGVLLPTNRVF